MMNPYDKYRQQMVSTMTQGEMLLKLYDETIRQIDLARGAIDSGSVKAMDAAIEKAQRIVRYLRSTLDFRYPVAENLAKLYDFFHVQLVMASVKKDVKTLNDIRPLVQELRETYDQCAKIDRSNRAGMAVANVV